MSIKKFFEEVREKTILAQYWKSEINTGVIQTIHFKKWKGGQILTLDDDDRILLIMDKIDSINIDEKEIIVGYIYKSEYCDLFLKQLETPPDVI
jgi:hypothetical protein